MDPLIDLALLLFGAKLGGILFSKLKQPSVAGELIAGIILGPSLLAFVKPSTLVSTVSDLGLLFLVLLVSLSIDWRTIEGSAEKYVWIEITRILLTFGMVVLLFSMFHLDTYTFLVISFVIILSSTAIASRTLADLKQLGSSEGKSLMGIEVVDEVVAIICVALLANMMSGGAIRMEPIVTTIFVVVGIFVVMNRVGAKFVNRATGSIQKYGIEEALLGFALLLAFILGSLTESLNLAAILGVFIAGMILSRSTQLPTITRKVKDIGESFFIPIFFASVGLAINLAAGIGNLTFILIIALAIIAIKMTVSIVTLKLFRYSLRDSIRIGTGIMTLSEMTVVIVAIAIAKLDPLIYVSIIASFMIINTVSPMLMSYAFKNEFTMGRKFKPVAAPKSKWEVPKPGKNRYIYEKKSDKEKVV